MHHIHITHAEAVEFLRTCEKLDGFISSESIMGRLMIAVAALSADGVRVDVSPADARDTEPCLAPDFPDSAERGTP